MAGTRPKHWNPAEKTLYLEVLTDYSDANLEQHLNTHDYWNVVFWEKLTTVYNSRAVTKRLPTVPPYEMILQGGRFHSDFCRQRSERFINPILNNIFQTCETCQKKIPVFPTSLLPQLGYVQTSRSENRYGVGSGAQSGAAGCGASVESAGQSGSAGTVPAQASSVIDLICSLENAGDIAVNEAASLFEQVDKWFKGDHAAWVTLLLNPALTDLDKLKYLKGTLNVSTSTRHG